MDEGQQVICIADFGGKWKNELGQVFPGPLKDQVLTIKHIEKYPDPYDIGFTFFELATYVGETEATFAAKHFRPIKKTSIEVFTKMLNKVDENV